MSAKNTSLAKGGNAEEALREYFSQMGSLVLRGVPVRSGGDDVTDVDLWVYTRPTSYSRHVSIVDIKHKRRGKPYERAIWVKGLQTALHADEAIIATQGAKKPVYEFASQMGVRVVSGTVFDAIVNRYSENSNRLSAEEVEGKWKATPVERTNLKLIVDDAKSKISDGITFSSLNWWIDQAGELLKLSHERERKPGPFLRASYLLSSLVAMGADFLGRKQILSEAKMRRSYFENGLLFGNTNEDAGRDFVEFAESMVTEYSDPSGAVAAQIRSGFERAVKEMPMEGLIEYFSRRSSGAELYQGSVALEAECFRPEVIAASDIPSIEAKIVIGLISDYVGLPRREILGSQPLPTNHEVDEVQGTLPL